MDVRNILFIKKRFNFLFVPGHKLLHIIYVTGMRYIFPFFLKRWICAILLFLSSKMHFQIHLCIIIPFEKRFLFFQEHWNRRPFMVKSTIKHLIADVTDTWWRMLHYQIIFAPQKTLKISRIIKEHKGAIMILELLYTLLFMHEWYQIVNWNNMIL